MSETIRRLKTPYQAAQMLPNVKSRKAARVFQDIVRRVEDSAFGRNGLGEPEFQPEQTGPYRVTPEVSVHPRDVRAMTIEDDFGNQRITPEGAAFLLRLYKAGVFELQRKRDGLGDTADLEAYAAKAEEFDRALKAEDEAQKRRRERFRYLVENPHAVERSEFDYGLLDQIFFRHKGPGSHRMEIGGYTVQKFVGPAIKSNSGKSSDRTVMFAWDEPNGTRQVLEKHSRYEGNRRNDADRNWGLPE